jgi:hypothetical protein
MKELTLELDNLATRLLLTSQLEVLAALDRQLDSVLAINALHTQDNLLCGLGLLAENRLSLATETGLFAVVTSATLSETRFLALLVLRNLVIGMLAAFAWAERTTSLWDVDHLVGSS